MCKDSKKIKIEYAKSNDVVRALVIAFLTCCIWLRGLFFKLLGSKKRLIITCSAAVSLGLLIFYPIFTRADADGPQPSLSIIQSDESAILTYGYREESQDLEDDNEIGYIDYIVTNDGDVDLNDVKFKFDDNYVKELQLPSNIEHDNVSLAKGTSITLRAFFKRGILVGEYNMEVSYSATVDEDEIELSNHVNFTVGKRNMIITVPDNKITAGDEVPIVRSDAFIIENLAEGDDINQCVSGIRDINYIVDDNTVSGEYLSEDLSSELVSSCYNVEFRLGRLQIISADDDEQKPDTPLPDDIKPDDATQDRPGQDDSNKDDVSPDNSDPDDSVNSNQSFDDESQPSETQTEDKDIIPPAISVSSPDMQLVGGTFVCRAAGSLVFDMTDNVGIDGVQCIYGDYNEFYQAVDNQVVLRLPDKFEGDVFYQARDLAGNMSDRGIVNVKIVEPVDNTAPTVIISSDDMKLVGDAFIAEDSAGTILFHASDVDTQNGDIVSGISSVIYSSDGTDKELPVEDGIAKLELSKSFQGDIFYQAVDCSGNKSEVQSVRVMINHTADDSVIKVKVPTNLYLFINPYGSKENICSNEYIIQNESDFDIECTISNVNQFINKDNVKDIPIDKSTNVNFKILNGDNSQSVKLSEGDSGQVYSGRILNGASEDNSLRFWFSGTINSESAEYWENGDLRMVITYDIRKCK